MNSAVFDFQADEKSPQFEEVYKSIAQQINMKVSSLDIVLQKSLCLAIMKYGNDLLEELKPLMTKRAGSEHDLQQTETGMRRHASSLLLHQISKSRGSPRLSKFLVFLCQVGFLPFCNLLAVPVVARIYLIFFHVYFSLTQKCVLHFTIAFIWHRKCSQFHIVYSNAYEISCL